MLRRDGPLMLQAGEETFTAFETDHARKPIREWFAKFSEKGYVVDRVAKREYLAPEAAPDQLPRELRSPLNDMAGSVKS